MFSCLWKSRYLSDRLGVSVLQTSKGNISRSVTKVSNRSMNEQRLLITVLYINLPPPPTNTPQALWSNTFNLKHKPLSCDLPNSYPKPNDYIKMYFIDMAMLKSSIGVVLLSVETWL